VPKVGVWEGRPVSQGSLRVSWMPQASNIDTGAAGGMTGHMTSLGHEPRHYTMFYVEVEDVQAYLDKATALGGKMLVPPVKIPTGTFAWFSDPDGNMIGLVKNT